MIRLQKKSLPSPLFDLALQFTSEAEDIEALTVHSFPPTGQEQRQTAITIPMARGQDSVHSENAINPCRTKSELAHAYNPSHSEAEAG